MAAVDADRPRLLPDHSTMPWLHAGFWRRVGAWLIDAIIISAIQWILWLVVGGWWWAPWTLAGHAHGTHAPIGLAYVTAHPLGIVMAWLYFALSESSPWQATVGKLALGLQVTDLRGLRVGFGRATGRFFGKFLSAMILGIGFLMAGWTARKQALHDLIAGCCVVRRDGLAAWQNDAVGRDASLVPAAGTAMPGWAVALIVFGCVFFLVIPVLAILAAITIPAYEAYTVRAQIAEGVDLSERARALVGQYIGERGALPDGNAALGLPRPEAIHARYVQSIRVVGGKVVVTYGNQASPILHGHHVVISPVGNATMLHWHCSSPDIRERYLPAKCRR